MMCCLWSLRRNVTLLICLFVCRTKGGTRDSGSVYEGIDGWREYIRRDLCSYRFGAPHGGEDGCGHRRGPAAWTAGYRFSEMSTVSLERPSEVLRVVNVQMARSSTTITASKSFHRPHASADSPCFAATRWQHACSPPRLPINWSAHYHHRRRHHHQLARCHLHPP
jgi:hypothetical protein